MRPSGGTNAGDYNNNNNELLALKINKLCYYPAAAYLLRRSTLFPGFSKYGIYSLFPGGSSFGSALYSHSTIGRFASAAPLQASPTAAAAFHATHKGKICIVGFRTPRPS